MPSTGTGEGVIEYPSFTLVSALQSPLEVALRREAIDYPVVLTPGVTYSFDGGYDSLGPVARGFISSGYLIYTDTSRTEVPVRAGEVASMQTASFVSGWGIDLYPVTLSRVQYSVRKITTFTQQALP